jgi:hypothetical protein
MSGLEPRLERMTKFGLPFSHPHSIRSSARWAPTVCMHDSQRRRSDGALLRSAKRPEHPKQCDRDSDRNSAPARRGGPPSRRAPRPGSGSWIGRASHSPWDNRRSTLASALTRRNGESDPPRRAGSGREGAPRSRPGRPSPKANHGGRRGARGPGDVPESGRAGPPPSST